MFDTYVMTVRLAKNLQIALDVEYGTHSTYLHTHMPKMNSSYVKICESSRPLLARTLPASRPESDLSQMLRLTYWLRTKEERRK